MTILKALKIDGAILEDGSSNGTTFNYLEVSDISTTNNFSPFRVADADDDPPGDVWTLPDGTTANQLQTFAATITIRYSDGTTRGDFIAYFVKLSNGETYQIELETEDEIYETKPLESLTVNSIRIANFDGWFATSLDDSFTGTVICFTSGTLIKTQGGEVAVETLSVGDMVLTMDKGYRPIRWIGSNSLDSIDLTLHPKLRPVRISAGVLGNNMPETDLTVSPQHRVLVRSVIAERMFDTHEVLLPAIKLVELDGIEQVQDATEVTYWHMLFDDHEIIFSNGAPTESLFTGPEALKSLSAESRAEITQLFPEITAPSYAPTPARPIPAKGKLMKQLVTRHAKNNKVLLEAKE